MGDFFFVIPAFGPPTGRGITPLVGDRPQSLSEVATCPGEDEPLGPRTGSNPNPLGIMLRNVRYLRPMNITRNASPRNTPPAAAPARLRRRLSVRLSWNEMRVRAAGFARAWAGRGV